MVNGYAYFKTGSVRAGGSRYTCPGVHKGCKAHLHIDKDDIITLASTQHNHLPRNYVRTNVLAGGSRYTCPSVHKGCKANLHIDKDDIITLASTQHNHPPRNYLQIINETKYITTTKGTRLLMLGEYTYCRGGVRCGGGTRYRCPNVNKGCKARVHVDEAGLIVLAVAQHNHPPHKYMKIRNGLYMKF
ncbi:unnamed protein product, partial [Iphiclides podalirius]